MTRNTAYIILHCCVDYQIGKEPLASTRKMERNPTNAMFRLKVDFSHRKDGKGLYEIIVGLYEPAGQVITGHTLHAYNRQGYIDDQIEKFLVYGTCTPAPNAVPGAVEAPYVEPPSTGSRPKFKWQAKQTDMFSDIPT